jgi:hypothetical protein
VLPYGVRVENIKPGVGFLKIYWSDLLTILQVEYFSPVALKRSGLQKE